MALLVRNSKCDQRACAYGELHALGTSGPELSGNNNLATLSARLHDEPQDTVASPSDGQTIEKLVSEGLALGDGGETTVLDLGGVEGDGVLGELESLLDERGELTDAATLLSKNLLGVCGADDDVGDSGGDADLDAGVTLLSELALEELVQLGVENTVCGGLACALFRCRTRYRNCASNHSSHSIVFLQSVSCFRVGKCVGEAYQRRTFSSWSCRPSVLIPSCASLPCDGVQVNSHCGLSGGHFVELWKGVSELRAWVFRKVEPLLLKS